MRQAVLGYEPYARARVQDLLGLLDGFRSAGVDVIPYKGPILSQRLYGHWAMRQFGDLDFLVRRQQARQAYECLVGRGFQPDLAASPGWELWYERARHEYALRNPANGLYVELHWGAWQRFVNMPVEVDSFWDHLEAVMLEGKSVLSLRMEELLFFLCLHGTKHQWNRLAWLADCAEIIRSMPTLDWSRVLLLAEASRSQRFLFVGLSLARRLLGAPLPPDVETRMSADDQVEALAAEMEAGLRSGSLHESGEGEHLRFMFRSLPRYRDRLRLLWGVAVEPCRDDWKYCRLPPSLVGLYAIVRPWRLLWKSAGRRGKRAPVRIIGGSPAGT